MISSRICHLASLTVGAKVIADIGCDHGYTIREAINNYGVRYAYALEVNKEPLKRAELTMKEANLSNKVSFYISDGLKDVDIDFDLAIISGMGGILITSILASSWEKFKGKTLVLEPQGNNNLVRQFLHNHNYKVIKESIIKENNKYYEIMLAVEGSEKLNYFEINYGKYLFNEKSPYYLEYYNKMLNIKRLAKTKTIHNEKLEKEILELEYVVGEKNMNKVLYDEANFYNELFIDDEARDLIVVFPGGGYDHTSEREAEVIALEFNKIGYHAVVFHYREKLDLYPEIYTKISKELAKYKDDKRVKNMYLNGYSAGGHLALELGLHQKFYDLMPLKGLILCYPVVSSDPSIAHNGSFKSLLGERDSLELRKRLSLELEVTEDAPKLFLWHTVSDQSVNVSNSLRLIEAYKKNDVNFSAFFYPLGGHGLGLANNLTARDEKDVIPFVATWFDLLVKWLEENAK